MPKSSKRANPRAQVLYVCLCHMRHCPISQSEVHDSPESRGKGTWRDVHLQESTRMGVVLQRSASGVAVEGVGSSFHRWECAGSVGGGSFKEDINETGPLETGCRVDFDPFTSSVTTGR